MHTVYRHDKKCVRKTSNKRKTQSKQKATSCRASTIGMLARPLQQKKNTIKTKSHLVQSLDNRDAGEAVGVSVE